MTKEELKSYRSILGEIAQLEEQIYRLEICARSPASMHTSDTPVSHDMNQDRIGDMLVKADELKNILYYKKIELLETQISIEKAISTLDTRGRILFRYRYIEGLKWEDICLKMSYSWNVIHNIHRNGLRELKNIK